MRASEAAEHHLLLALVHCGEACEGAWYIVHNALVTEVVYYRPGGMRYYSYALRAGRVYLQW